MAPCPLASPVTHPIGHALQRTWHGCGRLDPTGGWMFPGLARRLQGL